MFRGAPVVLAWAVAACGGGDPDLECDTQVTAACAPLYPPTFDNVYTMTLAPHCGSGARSCHSDAGKKGGMTFATIDDAYAALTAAGQDRVIAGDPACSIMIIRTNTTRPTIQMPPGSQLGAAERCSLVQWVAGGALRTGLPALPDAAVLDAAPADGAPPDAGVAP